ncbi:hypothetical protein ABB26_12665 [Stenotrophomonas humi]|uniref:Uncharacterized protein n=1 Tax=Stenotrophomonas humi TaxID=405444 RepID=A0A0R0BZZ6_9GAMM|nr:hypothetical protein ABB26_12665 [Stenotrophomonas humi]
MSKGLPSAALIQINRHAIANVLARRQIFTDAMYWRADSDKGFAATQPGMAARQAQSRAHKKGQAMPGLVLSGSCVLQPAAVALQSGWRACITTVFIERHCGQTRSSTLITGAYTALHLLHWTLPVVLASMSLPLLSIRTYGI